LPVGILAASALVTVGIVVFGPSFVGRSSAEVARQAASEPTETGEAAADCSGALATDYACHQGRYRDLVLDSGVEAAFAELKDEYNKNEFVRPGCHQLTHAIGRAAAERYGSIPGAYGRGEHFCGAGYYHGVIEAVTAEIGADRILQEAGTLCAELGEHRKYSVYHEGCAHGLGHGFMGVLDNELFESLETCDALVDGWEREHCYNGVFMENYDSGHSSKYLDVDLPLYPCTDVEDSYKTQCYQKQTTYALRAQDGDFAKVFDLCEGVEAGFRPACYHGLGRNALEESLRKDVTDAAEAASANVLCALGEDYEARSNCVIGAARYFVLYYHSDEQAKAFCDSLEAESLRAVCLRAAEEHHASFRDGAG
jgi:hypothetical protein